MTYDSKAFLETVMAEFERMQSRVVAADDTEGYEGVTHAGLAIVAADSGRVLLTQRAMDETDDESVRETWEFPGGHLEPGEEPFAGAQREFEEETGGNLPEGEVINGWRAGDNPETGHYQGFVYRIEYELPTDEWEPTTEVQAVGWFDSAGVQELENSGKMRPEIVATMDWSLVFPETGADEEFAVDDKTMSDAEEPMLSMADVMMASIPVHGVLAPEDAESGDSRGFNAGAVTARPYRLPFMYQKAQTSGHDGAVVVGSVDRLMRKDGLIHWEGALMPSEDASDFAGLLAFFGRFGVSVDGDRGSLDADKTNKTGVVWFDAVRAAGLTAVSIPAFAEAYVAFGPHPEMPEGEQANVLTASGDMVTFDRGPGWVTNPRETKRIHDYWTKKGQPGYAKIGWGTRGDFTRAKKLIGEKIGANSPEDMRYLNQIIAQWHYDALGYWPGDLDKPGNKTSAEAKAEREAKASAGTSITRSGIEAVEDGDAGWEAVLVSSAGTRTMPRLSYFHRPEGDFDALTIAEPDEFGVVRTFGYAAQWGVCHIGMSGRCVEPPRTWSDDYPQFHLGRTKTDEGYIYTGVLTYGIGHRDAETILNESAEQAYFDNINHAWAAVRVGEDDTGIWFSGVVLPDVPEDHLVKIEASGQVSGEWLRGAMRACLTVNVPGYAVERPSAVYDEAGNVLALAASAFGGVPDAPCEPTLLERMQALAKADAEARFEALLAKWQG